MSDDPFDLERFTSAQEPVYRQVVAELRDGRKRSHWMWFVFPQVAGLGSSPTAEAYAIRSLDEAKSYLAHPVLGPRLRECTELALGVEGRSAREVFGSPDDMKFRSSMTLFGEAAPEEPLFGAALRKYYPDGSDRRTLELLVP